MISKTLVGWESHGTKNTPPQNTTFQMNVGVCNRYTVHDNRTRCSAEKPPNYLQGMRIMPISWRKARQSETHHWKIPILKAFSQTLDVIRKGDSDNPRRKWGRVKKKGWIKPDSVSNSNIGTTDQRSRGSLIHSQHSFHGSSEKAHQTNARGGWCSF